MTPEAVAHWVPLHLGFFQAILKNTEYWSGLPFPPPGDFPEAGIETRFPTPPALQADSLPAEPLGKPILH